MALGRRSGLTTTVAQHVAAMDVLPVRGVKVLVDLGLVRHAKGRGK
jgi:hypothetical protein